jgi:hypothetical protein
MDVWISVLALILVGSLFLFAWAVNNRRPQVPGLVLAVLTLVLYAAYYSDRNYLKWTHARTLLHPLQGIPGVNVNFRSVSIAALIITAVYLCRIIVYQRVSVRRRLEHISDPIANFFSGATLAVVAAAIIDSLFSWGWIGALVLSAIAVLIYLGIFGMFEGILEIVQELFGYQVVKILRYLSKFATYIVRAFSYVASMYKRLVPDLERIADSFRTRTEVERQRYREQVAKEDELLTRADMKNRSRRHRRQGQ